MKDSQKEALRLVIRELLAQELGGLREGKKQTQPENSAETKEENVTVASTEELTAFARRICALAQDEQAREDIEAGRWIFHPHSADKTKGSEGGVRFEEGGVRFEKGVVGEGQVTSLAEDSCIWAGKQVCFTPLALDEIRRRRIRIERET
ncbi:MAG: hypothetical protein OXF05_06840 [Hyphomicrobiales bacterium]|nr:hypothetical protein [Hyphomicrobiales bacterium]MCY4033676.1 hypothetical protein [Hyphomicrobiales bacterium]MCY4038477.1 hypothetical protein [Hyphomicrobiales bacterium]